MSPGPPGEEPPSDGDDRDPDAPVDAPAGDPDGSVDDSAGESDVPAADDSVGEPDEPAAPATSGRDAGTRRERAADEKFCPSCGEPIERTAEICPACGVRQQAAGTTRSDADARNTAAVLAILLGGVGAHKFYLGNVLQGLLYLSFFWTILPAIAGIVEGVLYLTQSDEAFRRKHLE